MDEKRLNEFAIEIISKFEKLFDIEEIYDRCGSSFIMSTIEKIFQYGYETGSQETANELGKQVEQQLKQAFKRF